ncbi:hypothetical protein [Allomesorhizobium camelthorni]|uniref:Type II toxin-antitoxin system prevent-host-death family antitoxin n=1 Tax=Allomesorhizobium camelthorni TaxID=475069 RepID=A0A6G4WAE5_9HYPH|nr:hypothetical protein [Mesorhizobium camelthorni]NGO51097.1 hypothetical protein [Mesorhizobium camelthorni]
MSTGLGKESGASKDSNVWDVPEARKRFDDLLEAAASRGPQIIRDDNRQFKVTLDRASSSPKGRALLAGGGPLEDDNLPND